VQSVYHCKWCFYNSEFIAGKSQAQPSSCGVLSFINTVFSGSRHKPHARCHDNVHVQVSDAMVQSIRCVRRQLRAHACSFYSQDAIWESRKESTCELIWPVPCSLKECTECPSNQVPSRDASRCMSCGDSTLGIQDSSHECVCAANSILQEKSEVGPPFTCAVLHRIPI